MTAKANVTQAEIKRAVKAVQDVGLPISEVKVTPLGEVRVICQPIEGDAKGWGV